MGMNAKHMFSFFSSSHLLLLTNLGIFTSTFFIECRDRQKLQKIYQVNVG